MLAPVINVLVIDKIGRKYTILLCGLPIVASWSIILITRSAYMWYVARFLSGISVGVGFVVAPIYLGEISSVKTRGANGTMISIMCNIGILVSFIIVPYYSIRNTTASFIFLSICFVFLFSFIPESPYYLAMRGRMEEAEETLQKLRGRTDVSDELTKIDQFIKKEENNKIKFWSTLKDIFMIRRHRRAFFIIFLLTFNNFFSSYLPLIFYGQLIFKEILSTVSDYTINIVAGITLLLSSIVTGCFVDRLGRKLIILVSGFCSILSIMMSEVFAAEVKVLSTCILGIIGGILAMINDQLYILLAISLNYGHGLPFFGFCLLVWLSTALLYHFSLETKDSQQHYRAESTSSSPITKVKHRLASHEPNSSGLKTEPDEQTILEKFKTNSTVIKLVDTVRLHMNVVVERVKTSVV
ncbi:facilitated trehalose transporter Tret1-like [Polistes fuscatus]|uniref:facilitated trehalose transporter Tret1-like n=1 Tax=Polistes fuscatus TaxID=30207 RepID=UPI001CA7F7F8|nr:facilitated trehalose transporter Tret1-like [Polistes fuscatus]